jgi:hypothetical protein
MQIRIITMDTRLAVRSTRLEASTTCLSGLSSRQLRARPSHRPNPPQQP